MTTAFAGVGWLDLVASVVLAGGILFAALIGPPSPAGARVIRLASALLAVVLPAEFGLTAYRTHLASGAGGVSLLTDLLATQWGRLWILRGVGLAVLVARPPGVAWVAVLWLMARSFQGHAGAHGTVPALIDWVHLLAASAWLGALAQAALLPTATPAIAVRIRTLATASIVFLVPAGVYGAFLHVPHLRLLAESPYGRTLLAKLVGAAALLGLGAVNHFRHVPALRRGEPDAAAALARTVRREVVLGVVVLLLTALLRELPMPHAMG